MTNPTGTKPFVRVSIYHQNDLVFDDLTKKIKEFLESMKIEEKDLKILSVETQIAGEHTHMDVDVQVEIYGDINVEMATIVSDMYDCIALDHFRLRLVVEKRDGIVLRNF